MALLHTSTGDKLVGNVLDKDLKIQPLITKLVTLNYSKKEEMASGLSINQDLTFDSDTDRYLRQYKKSKREREQRIFEELQRASDKKRKQKDFNVVVTTSIALQPEKIVRLKTVPDFRTKPFFEKRHATDFDLPLIKTSRTDTSLFVRQNPVMENDLRKSKNDKALPSTIQGSLSTGFSSSRIPGDKERSPRVETRDSKTSTAAKRSSSELLIQKVDNRTLSPLIQPLKISRNVSISTQTSNSAMNAPFFSTQFGEQRKQTVKRVNQKEISRIMSPIKNEYTSLLNSSGSMNKYSRSQMLKHVRELTM